MGRPQLPSAARLVALGTRVRASTAAVLAEEAARRSITLGALVRELAEHAAAEIAERDLRERQTELDGDRQPWLPGVQR